jgi:hypothetical protein
MLPLPFRAGSAWRRLSTDRDLPSEAERSPDRSSSSDRRQTIVAWVVVIAVSLGACELDRRDAAETALPLALSGAGAAGWQETPRFVLTKRPASFQVRYEGSGRFQAHLSDGRHWSLRVLEGLAEIDSLGWPDGQLPRVLDAAGPVETTKEIAIRETAKYRLRVRADGPWTIAVTQPP